MRPIDADAFKEYLEQGTELALKEAMLAGILTKKVEKEIDETLKGILADINEQPTVNEWTPCSERLPENGDGVLFTINKRIEIGVYLKKRDIWICNDEYGTVYDHSSVVAWMPLPEPYKEVEE